MDGAGSFSTSPTERPADTHYLRLRPGFPRKPKSLPDPYTHGVACEYKRHDASKRGDRSSSLDRSSAEFSESTGIAGRAIEPAGVARSVLPRLDHRSGPRPHGKPGGNLFGMADKCARRN